MRAGNVGCVVAAVLMLLAVEANAATHIRIGLDTDGVASGPCMLDGADGFELLLSIDVDGAPPMVTATTLAVCDPVGGDYGTPVALGGGWPVGLDLGEAGSDVVEAFVPRAFLVMARVVRLRTVVTGSGGSDVFDSDLRLLLSGPAPAPALSPPALLLALALLLMLAWRRRASGAWSAALALACSAVAVGVAVAAIFRADGLIDDWAGVAPRLVDAGADTDDPTADLVAMFTAADGQALWVRVDVADLYPPPTPTPSASATPTAVDTVTATPTDTSPPPTATPEGVGTPVEVPTTPVVVGTAVPVPTTPVVVGTAVPAPTTPVLVGTAVPAPTTPVLVGTAVPAPTEAPTPTN